MGFNDKKSLVLAKKKNDAQFNKYFKIFIFTYTSDFLNINPHLRAHF